MRILHANKFLYRRGGAESYMLDVAGLQQARGHDVGFFAMSHPQNDPAAHADAFPPRMELDPPPEGAGARIRTAAEIVWRPSARRGMAEVLEREQPDVVHLHNIYHQLSPAVLAPLRDAGVPSVMTLHDYKLVCPTYQMRDAEGRTCDACLTDGFRAAVRKRCNGGSLAGSLLSGVEARIHRSLGLYDSIDLLICPSRFMYDTMRRGGIDERRLVHVPHFAEIDAVEPARAPGSGVVFAGRLSEEKGVDTLIAAAALMPREITVTIIGDGPEREALTQLADRQTDGAAIRFTGRLSRTEVQRAMAEAAVVAVPSRWNENQPMTILEAFAAGRPVVASAMGGMSELVDSSRGRLVPAESPQALAQALTGFASDPVAAHGHGRRGRAYAAQHFSVDTHLERLEDLYHRVGSGAPHAWSHG